MDAFAESIWHVIGPDLRMPGGVRMPSRSTVIRMADDTLVVYSPILFDDATAAEIDALGVVGHIIAPSRIHHRFVASSSARWPQAIVHGAPGLADKCPDLRIDKSLDDCEPSWQNAIDIEVIGGAPKLNEAVVFHRPSGTLVCADLVFNITRPANLRTRIALAIMGVGGGRLGQSRAWRMFRTERAPARASIDRILSWPIRRVAPCHGESLIIDASTLAHRMTRAYGGPVRHLLR